MKNIIYIVFIVFTLLSCDNEEVVDTPEIEWSKTESTDLNKEFTVREKIDIKFYLERHPSWEMTESGSGLYFHKYENGEGAEAKVSRVAQVQFEISLLDGTVVYSTEDDEVEEFKIGHSHVESGVQEAIEMMREGDRAKIIVPSHLAHGLTGDYDKIPALTAIVVDLYLHKIVR